MKLYGIGNAVYYYRTVNELSQLQVCEGICLEITLSRIETGEREFDSLISGILLERVGKTVDRFEFVLNDEDYHLYCLREKIQAAVDTGDVENAKAYIGAYRNDMPLDDKLHEQFLLYHEALCMKQEHMSGKDIVEKLYEAINLTRGDFLEPTNNLRLYSVIEIKIIYELSLYEEYSYEELKSIFQFVEKLYDEEKKAELLVPFYYELAKRYEQEKNYYSMKRVTEQALALVQRSRSYLYLVELQYMNLNAKYQLFHTFEDWEEIRKELVEQCNNIYYMSMATDNETMIVEATKFCEEKLKWQITV